MNRVYETAQAYYDALIAASSDGTFPSISAEGVCLYRVCNNAGTTHKCAAGIMIPDEMVARFAEKEGVYSQANNELFKSLLPDEMSIDDLAECQQAHDDSSRVLGGVISWDQKSFVENINQVGCFAGCTKRDPKNVEQTI